MITVPMTVSVTSTEVPVKVATDQATLTVGIGAAYEITGGETYHGAYTVTPSQETQILETNGLLMNGNVTIEPIPQNYGLVTWNGSVLTIS